MAALRWVEQGRTFVYPALASLGMGVLACCAERPPPPPPRTVAAGPPRLPQSSPMRLRVFPLPEHKPTPPSDNPGGTPPTPAIALAAPEATPRLFSTNKLIGLDEPAAKRLLGPAAEQSDAPPATIWRYRSADCELDLFFYLDLKSGKMRTLHYAFKGQSDDAAGQQDCLRSLVVARKG